MTELFGQSFVCCFISIYLCFLSKIFCSVTKVKNDCFLMSALNFSGFSGFFVCFFLHKIICAANFLRVFQFLLCFLAFGPLEYLSSLVAQRSQTHMNALIVVRSTESNTSVYLSRTYDYYLWYSCKEVKKKRLGYSWTLSEPS